MLFTKLPSLLFSNKLIIKLSNNISKLQHPNRMCSTVSQIVNRLQEFAPLNLAETWDNVGLLVDPMSKQPVNVILLTNDLTEDVVNEAIQTKAGLIISYHPNIFQGLKSVSNRTWKERIVVQCIRNEIAVFSPHTTWDSVKGGVNDWLAAAFDFNSIKPINPNIDNSEYGSGRYLTLQNPIKLEQAINRIKEHIGISHLRLAIAKGKVLSDTLISTVALCAGSGNSVLSGTRADLYLTGEMLHHDVLDATQKGINVILCNHSDSERGFLKVFQNLLQEQILKNDDVKVLVSSIDKDPLVTV